MSIKSSNNSSENKTEYNKVNAQTYTRNDILICATHGHIYAIYKSNGTNIWDAKFPTSVSGGLISVFITDSDRLIVGGFGKTACMDLFTGKTIWVNNMRGFGFQHVSVLSTPSKFLPPTNLHPKGMNNDHPPSYTTNEGFSGNDVPIVLACSNGIVSGVDSLSGKTLWNCFCLGGGLKIPTALIDPPSVKEGTSVRLAYVGAGKFLFCLDVLDKGRVLWKKQISDCYFGYDCITMTTHWSSRLAAETHTAFNQNPVAQARALSGLGNGNKSKET